MKAKYKTASLKLENMTIQKVNTPPLKQIPEAVEGWVRNFKTSSTKCHFWSPNTLRDVSSQKNSCTHPQNQWCNSSIVPQPTPVSWSFCWIMFVALFAHTAPKHHYSQLAAAICSLPTAALKRLSCYSHWGMWFHGMVTNTVLCRGPEVQFCQVHLLLMLMMLQRYITSNTMMMSFNI